MKEKKSYLSELDSKVQKLVSDHAKLFSAVPRSLYSDTSEDRNWEWKLCIPKRVRNNPQLLIYYLIIITEGKPFWKELFIEFCASQSKRFGYQGKWRKLHKLAKLQFASLIKYRITEEFSPNEFFGNMLPGIEKELENFSIQFLKQQKPSPKTIQRRRGYNDKGSMRKIHEIHDCSVVSGPNKERENYDSQYRKRLALVNFLYG